MKKFLIIIAVVMLIAASCTTVPDTVPEGDVTWRPGGYIRYCHEHPLSIFCEEFPYVEGWEPPK